MSTVKKGRFSKSEIEYIEEHYTGGDGIEEIATHLNRSLDGVFKVIQKNNFKQEKQAEPAHDIPVKNVFAKPNRWSDDGTLAIGDKAIDKLIVRNPVERTRKNKVKEKILATCRHCDEQKMAEPHLISEGSFSCKTCLKELSAR